MGRYFHVVLEYDGENPVRNTFLCEIGDFYYSELRYWEDLYDSDLRKHSDKKHSIKTQKVLDCGGFYSWGINNIPKKIEAIRKEIEQDTELGGQGKKNLNGVIYDLQKLHDTAMEKCSENNINTEKCYINWCIQ